MSGMGEWAAGPPGSSVSRDGHRLRVPDASYLEYRVLPSPLKHAELEAWVRVAPSVAFSLHPAGALVLYDQARAVLEEVGATADLDASQRGHLNRECWRAATSLFTPGAPVRTAMDRFTETGGVRPRLTGIDDEDEQLLVTQLAYLAAWAVFRAAADITEEAADVARAR